MRIASNAHRRSDGVAQLFEFFRRLRAVPDPEAFAAFGVGHLGEPDSTVDYRLHEFFDVLVFAPHAGARQVPDSDTDAVHALGTGDVEPALVDAQRDATEILAVGEYGVRARGAGARQLVD